MRFPRKEGIKDEVRKGIKDFSIVCENTPPMNLFPLAYNVYTFFKMKLGK